MTTRGFYSVVQDRDDDRHVLIRARARADLHALRGILPDLPVWRDPSADYAWRSRAERSECAYALGVMAGEIDYPNFKDAVARRQGRAGAGVYEKVWSVLL